MLIKRPDDIKPSEITPQEIYLKRREFIGLSSALALGAAFPGSLITPAAHAGGTKLSGYSPASKTPPYGTDEELTPYNDVTRYNNFYEFSTDKEGPARLAKNFRSRPWTVTVEGEVGKPGVYNLDDFIKPHALEERIYRLRCVEAWSMVIPWIGVPLRDVIKRLEPTSRAKYVEFTTLYDPTQMPGQRRAVLRWPYVEGLRIDEAMHPLTLLAVGLYGEVLPNQNGAPLRLVIPWKYGFKNIKSIVKIRLVEKQPISAWMDASASEYGFYANVNPQIDHPRWSQGRERRIGEIFKRKTLMFNGYANQVASLYSGMDLKKYF